MSSHTLEGKKKTQNGVKRLMFTVLSILLEVVFLVGIFKGLNEYAVVIDNMTRIFAVILVLKIYGRNETSSMKTPDNTHFFLYNWKHFPLSDLMHSDVAILLCSPAKEAEASHQSFCSASASSRFRRSDRS